MFKFIILILFTITLFAQDYYHKGNLEKLKQDCKKRDQLSINKFFYDYSRGYSVDESVIKVLLKDCKADINYESDLDKYSTYKRLPPLFRAIHSGNYNLVKLYVESGVNINQDTPWRSPLRYAILKDKKDSYKIFSYLLKKGANPNYKDASGVSIIKTIARATFKDSKPKKWKKSDNRLEELFYAKELLRYNVIVTKEDIQWAKRNGKIKLYELLNNYMKSKKEKE